MVQVRSVVASEIQKNFKSAVTRRSGAVVVVARAASARQTSHLAIYFGLCAIGAKSAVKSKLFVEPIVDRRLDHNFTAIAVDADHLAVSSVALATVQRTTTQVDLDVVRSGHCSTCISSRGGLSRVSFSLVARVLCLGVPHKKQTTTAHSKPFPRPQKSHYYLNTTMTLFHILIKCAQLPVVGLVLGLLTYLSGSFAKFTWSEVILRNNSIALVSFG